MELFAIYIDLPDDDSVLVGHRALARFCELLQSKSCDDVSIEDIAEQAGITADHLRELFRLRFGMRPLEYRTGLRLARARELLSTSTLNVKEVAHKVGNILHPFAQRWQPQRDALPRTALSSRQAALKVFRVEALEARSDSGVVQTHGPCARLDHGPAGFQRLGHRRAPLAEPARQDGQLAQLLTSEAEPRANLRVQSAFTLHIDRYVEQRARGRHHQARPCR
jgi:hypothetical protein